MGVKRDRRPGKQHAKEAFSKSSSFHKEHLPCLQRIHHQNGRSIANDIPSSNQTLDLNDEISAPKTGKSRRTVQDQAASFYRVSSIFLI